MGVYGSEAARLEVTSAFGRVRGPRISPGSWTEQWLRLEEQAARALRGAGRREMPAPRGAKAKIRGASRSDPAGRGRLWTPMVECRVKLPGAARREMVFYYDPLQRAALDLACDGCGAPLHTVYQCGEGDLVCPDCFAPCTACSAPMSVRVVRRCHVCDGPLCGGCDAACPAGAFGLHADLHVCPTRRMPCARRAPPQDDSSSGEGGVRTHRRKGIFSPCRTRCLEQLGPGRSGRVRKERGDDQIV